MAGLVHLGTLVYVASPYSSKTRGVQDKRAIEVSIATGFLMNNYKDICFYSPISHTHPIASLCNLPGDWAFWQKYDETVLSRCDALWVLCIDGWQESTGVQAEIEIARRFGIDVSYIHPMGADNYKVVQEEPRG